MSDLISTLRAIIRDELQRQRGPELGIVTQVYPRADKDSGDNHQINVRLRTTGLELQRVPVAVARPGLSSLPRTGDLVVLLFVGGDLNAPVAMGALYDEQTHPPTAEEGEVVYAPQKDPSGIRRLHVEFENGQALTFGDDALTVQCGDTMLEINRDGDIAIKAAGSITIEAGGDVKISASGKIAAEARDAATLKGLTAALEGQTEAKVKGAQVGLAGITQFSPS